jgi:hypothetical protein
MVRLLLAVDRNLESSFALRSACLLPGENRIVPIHVVELAGRDLSFGAGWARKSWEQEAMSLARQSLRELIDAERVQCSAIEDPLLLVGDPVQEIVRTFGEQKCDLLVAGIPYRGMGPVSLCKRFGQHAEKGHLELPALLVRRLRPVRKVLASGRKMAWP